ncbi:MAG: APC family permease [Armatimonadota bacterium]
MRLIIGRPLATSVQLEHRLPIYLALPVFASDALSSVAYATEEILLAFEHGNAAAAALQYLIPISIAIALLIFIVGTSYRQAIHLYPSGGGSYSVSRDNLGVLPGLIAASALIIDYVLTVAVSVSSGVEHLTSALPVLQHPVHLFGYSISTQVLVAVLLVFVIALMNIRGTKESGWAFALPAYTFVTLLLMVLVATVYRYFFSHDFTPIATAAVPHTPSVMHAAGLFLILRAFASGCSAITGVEAVSNGVSAFEPPEAKNAAKTLLVLIIILVILFIGVGFAATVYRALPAPGATTISQIAEAAFGGRNLLYYLTTIATLAVLMIAANTSFAGFPRLLAIVAQDGYSPKAFVSLGDRLVHTRGILALTVVSILLIMAFNAKTNSLIPLYAVGVFICFTLSQMGMVRKVRELKEKGWKRMMLVNLVGAIVTGIVAIIQAVTKFTQGAWMVVVILPILVLISYLIKRHYDWFDETMTIREIDPNPLAEEVEPVTVLVLISSDVHRGTLEGLECARAIAERNPGSIIRAVHIEMDPTKTQRLLARWAQLVEPHLGKVIQLDIVPSPYRWLIEPVKEYIDKIDLERLNDRVIIVLPEFETGSFMTHFLHNFTGRRLRAVLLNRPHITVVSSRYFMRPIAWRRGRGGLVY